MKLINLNEDQQFGLKEVEKLIDLKKYIVQLEVIVSNCFQIEYKDQQATIYINKPNQFYVGIAVILGYQGKDFSQTITTNLEQLTYMVDQSRNAVLKVESVKRLGIYLALFGYDALQLYTEDTFELDEAPYFGYLRGRWTRQEIQAVESYLAHFGIELVPCIQTLAHLNGIKRYPEYTHLFDTADILLVGDDKTYELIEKMIQQVSKTFKSKTINIGMDEAYMLGRGRFLDQFGYQDRFDIMINHLKRVLKIVQKYGLKPMMWSDMFFKMSMALNYDQAQLSKKFIEKIPKEVRLVYWDYYQLDQTHYEKMIDKHLKFGNEIYFAGGVWKWIGFTPDNRFSIEAAKAQMKAVKNKKLKHVLVTSWGDNGNEASFLSIMPSLSYYGFLKYFNEEKETYLKSAFKEITQVAFDDFLLIDSANRLSTEVSDLNSANKHFLYNDILLGLLDTAVDTHYQVLYEKHLKNLKDKIEHFGDFRYVFETQLHLLDILRTKVDLGVKLRAQYQTKDMLGLKKSLKELELLIPKIKTFHQVFLKQWHQENKAFGFEIQDLRIGGLIQRVETAIFKVNQFLNLDIDHIEELTVNLLDYYGKREIFQKVRNRIEYRYLPIVSVGVNV